MGRPVKRRVCLTQSVRELAESKGIEVRTTSTETLFPLRGYVDRAGGSVKKLPNSYGSFEGLMGKMGKVPQPLEAPTRESLPEQDHGGLEGSMLPPQRPTDLPWPRGTPKVGTASRNSIY